MSGSRARLGAGGRPRQNSGSVFVAPGAVGGAARPEVGPGPLGGHPCPARVRWISPLWTRNGSYASSMVSGSSPTHCASVVRPDRLAAEAGAQRDEDGPVDLVEAELVHAEELEPLAGRGARR